MNQTKGKMNNQFDELTKILAQSVTPSAGSLAVCAWRGRSLDSGRAGRRGIDHGRLPVSGPARPGGGARTWRRGEIFLRADRSVYRATLPAAAPVQGSSKTVFKNSSRASSDIGPCQ